MQFDLRKFIASGSRPWHREFSCDLSARRFSGARIPQPVQACFDAELDGEEVHVALRAKAMVQGECARCLDSVSTEEAVEVEWVIKESDLTDPDFELPLDGNGKLDVEEWLFQEFLLSVPSVLLCSPECEGLCPECGRKRAACCCQKTEEHAPAKDARLSVLQSLLN